MIPVEYPISDGINGVFVIPTQQARSWLPAHLQPLEVQHGQSGLGITLFSFSDSPVGPYTELVVSLYVVPQPGLGPVHPHAGVYPLVVASSSEEARQHAIELWHLPHFMEDIHITFTTTENGERVTGRVQDSTGDTILSLQVSQTGKWLPVVQSYQSFQGDESGFYTGILDMEGMLSEHEEGSGVLTLYPQHRYFDNLDLSQMEVQPIREMWLKNGVERYHKLLDKAGQVLFPRLQIPIIP